MFSSRVNAAAPEISALRQTAQSAGPDQVESALQKSRATLNDFSVLLSPAAKPFLEAMARKSSELTRAHFGNAISLFTPIYISNVCDNFCKYCSFKHDNAIARRHLTPEEIDTECRELAHAGMRNILVLTGESRKLASPGWLGDSIGVVKRHFASVAIEVYPLTQAEYALLIAAGVDSLTIFQEVYNKEVYERLHAGGPKADHTFRLDAPDRAALAGMRAINIGPLLGLADFRSEALWTAMHLHHLQDSYPGVELALSLPRIRPLTGDFVADAPVGDREFVQLLCAMRIAFPTVGITVSTRESAGFRNAIAPLGVTRMSAGVSTAVGGHSSEPSTSQFEIADSRSVDEMKSDLIGLGLQPVMHDWNQKLTLR